jgi:sugar O-acyltransferase (sialic acid O-acetyltransferase NeuD family)
MGRVVYGVYGSGGFGREVMPLAREQLAGVEGGPELVFIDDSAEPDAVVNGHRALRYPDFLALPCEQRCVAIAVGNSTVRQRLADQCALDGVQPFEIRAGSAVVLDGNRIGGGAILCGFTTVTSNATIGRHFHANLYAYIAHDCVVGDYVTLAPGAKVNGGVVLEDHVYVGTGAIIRERQPGRPVVIGRGAVIGMGAVVTRSVAAGTTVVGNPARELARRNE